MSDFQDLLHDFVQASNDYREVSDRGHPGSEIERKERELAGCGDRLESVLRKMMLNVSRYGIHDGATDPTD